MEKFSNILIVLHVIAGFTAFFLGPVAIFTNKFGKSHKIAGRIFSIAMTIVFVTAVIVSIYKQNTFLFMVAMFSFYSVVSGVRILKVKSLGKQKSARWYDWTIHGIFLITCLSFMIFAIYLVNSHGFIPLAILSGLFSIGGMASIYTNLKPFLRNIQPKNFWLDYHRGNMIGAYIATVTAFSAVQMDFMPFLLQWTWPTLVILPASAWFNRKYRSAKKESVLTEN
ncbi:MAG: hypothetical protein WBA74_20190 [Cyclobacteriaceae bacterium]